MSELPPITFDFPTPHSGGVDTHFLVPDTPPSTNETLQFDRPIRPALHTGFSSSSSATTTLEKNHEELWRNLSQFYDDNEEVINKSLATDLAAAAKDEKTTEVQIAIDSFVETANVVLEGLVALGNVHPILGVAIFAFHSVMRLDLARRDNNKKVLAVKLQMQNMMCTMFQLRNLKHVHVHESQKEQEKERLQRLIKVIADDITKCGSDLNYYMDRKFVSKLLNAKAYERRFADHIETFVQHRSELQNSITAYIAAGMDTANITINTVEEKVDKIDQKLDSFIKKLFRKLDTSREIEVLSFVEQHGGNKECISKDELLLKLLGRAGESLDSERWAMDKAELLAEYRKNLFNELNENLDAVLAHNLSRFERLLVVQSNNMERISAQILNQGYQHNDHSMKLDKLVSTSILILEEGKLIKKAVVPNSKVKLKDPEFQQIWDRMGLRRSVKAKNFVLTFRDHLLSDRSMPGTPYPSTNTNNLNGQSSSLLMSSTPIASNEPLPTPNNLRPDGDQDLWVFDYIDVQHVQPIVEAMDEDGSGFISVKEANKFALSRPKGMNLLHWIAFWAAGWHINLTYYYHKIYTTMIEIHQALEDAHPSNRSYVEIYVNYYYFIRIEGVLRSIKVLPDDARHEPKLVEIAENMRNLQEQRLFANLSEISFLLESPANVLLVAGAARAETWILPLIYLLLKRHLEIIKLAQKRVISEKELPIHSESFMHIFSVFDERMRNLEVIFLQIYRETEAQFGNHAYGMFYTSFKNTTNIELHNKLFYYRDTKGIGPKPEPEQALEEPATEPGQEKMERNDGKEPKQKPVDTSILNQTPDDNFTYTEVDLQLDSPPPDHTPHSIEGSWMGVCYRSSNPLIAYQGCLEIRIGPVIDCKITGKARSYLGLLNIEGHMQQVTDVEGEPFEVVFKIISPTFSDIWCKGLYDPSKDVIRGQWVLPIEGDSEDVSKFPGPEELAERASGEFVTTRTPADVYRFRHIIDCPGVNPSWTIAKRRWSYAIEAVISRTKRAMNSSKVVKSRLAERKAWIELATRDYLESHIRTTRGHLTDLGRQELLTLTWTVPPENAAIYERLSIYLHNRMNYHRGLMVCDVCDQRVTFTRFVCITCVEEDFTNQVDLCPECIESRSFSQKRSFVHHLSHSLIRATVRLHYCEMAGLILQARSLSERIKASFTAANSRKTSELDMNIKSTKYSESKASKDLELENIVTSRPSLTPLICACCLKELTLPCWGCVTCALDTLLCLECEYNNESVLPREGFSGVHTRKHPLLRINDSSEVKTTIEPKTTRLERRLVEMEERLGAGINEGLSILEEKVNIRLDAIQTEMQATTVQEVARLVDMKGEPPRFSTPLKKQVVSQESSCDSDNTVTSDSLVQTPYEARLEERLTKLEAKVDDQFERILGLMREVVSRLSAPVQSAANIEEVS